MLIDTKGTLLISVSVLLVITWNVLGCLLFCVNIFMQTGGESVMSSTYVFSEFYCGPFTLPWKKRRALFQAE